MRKQLLLLLFSFFAVLGYARTVTGVVTSQADGEPIIGASVVVKGTTIGTVTDIDGNYSIEIKDDNAVLVFTYVGMEPQSVKVGSQSKVNVVMKDNATVLSEVVVTAMGQVQEKKKLNFAVQSLGSEDVTAGSTANIVNSLQGKIAGLQVSLGGGSPNASSSVVVRAISSMNPSQSNDPLMIVDGVAVRGTSLSDINPNDIENMTVLKGAAASALYGQEAANGVLMITTKSAKNGKIQVNASATFEVSNAARVPKIQNTFAGGSSGFYKENTAGGWGPYLKAGEQIYDNVGDFLGTGFLQKYDVALTGGNDLFSSYASVGYTKNDGIVPNDYKNQLNVFLKGSYNPSKQVKMQVSANIVNTKSRGFGNSMSTIYGWAINKDMSDYETSEGMPNWSNRYDNWDALTGKEKLTATLSPYFGRYKDKAVTEGTRIMLNGSISYEPIEKLVFTGRVGYDRGYSTYDAYTVPRYTKDDFIDPATGKYYDYASDYSHKFGSYSFQPSRSTQLTTQILATYERELIKDLNMNVLVGFEYKENRSYSASLAGRDFKLGAGFYSFNNVDPEYFLMSGDYPLYLNHSESNKYGYFGELRFDYKGMAQVSVTGRYDGSSKLKQSTQTSYFYPSFTGGLIFSELFNLKNDWFSFGKIRGNWAKVGKDGPANLFSNTYKSWATFPDGGYGVDPTTSRAITLVPEMTSSWEIGADLRFFNQRTRLDVAYYSTIVDNQIVTVRVSPASGTILQTRNEGELENYGVEATLSQDIMKTKDFSWTAFANFSFNRGRVLSLPDQLTEIQGTQYGDIFPTSYKGGSSTAVSGKDYQRSPSGDILIDENGFPLISPNKGNLIGNREPDFLLGIGSNFQWKDLSVSFLVDGRCGGDVVNITGRSLVSNGQHHLLSKYRNREVIFKGVVAQPDGTYKPNTTPVVLDQYNLNTYFYAVSSNFIEDGSYIRLSYVTVAYDFSKMLAKGCPVKGLSASLTGRNLFLLTKYSGSDPQIQAGSGTNGAGSNGIDNYNVPQTRSFNLTLKATF